jgi:lipopolysaccharide export system permease protein
LTLTRYVSRAVGLRVLLALLGLAGLLQIVDLLDNIDTLLASDEGALGMLLYSLWRVPTIVEQVLPMAMLGGSIVAFFSLVRTNQIVAMRAAGVTSLRLLASALPVALAVAVVQFALADQITPWSEPRFTAWFQAVKARTKAPDDQDETADRVWMRAGPLIIAAAIKGPGLTTMQDLTFVKLNDDGEVNQRMDAALATIEDGAWRLHDIRNVVPEEASVRVTRTETMAWPVAVPADEVLAVLTGQDRLSSAQIISVLEGQMPATASPPYYWTTLHRSFAHLLSAPLMLLLALPAAFGSTRQGGSVWGLLAGGVLGIASLVSDGIFAALGEVGYLPPLLAAWITPLAFSLIGCAILFKFEEP